MAEGEERALDFSVGTVHHISGEHHARAEPGMVRRSVPQRDDRRKRVKKVYVNPQWQGGADLSTWHGAEELNMYLDGQDYAVMLCRRFSA